MKELLLGAHTSTSGGVDKAIDRAKKLNFNAIQIFTKNNNRWQAKDLDSQVIADYKSKLENSDIKYVVAHDSYLINLCAKDPELLEKSRNAFVDEIKRCEQLGIKHLNFHPGSHGGQGEEDGIKIIAESINIAFEQTKDLPVMAMLEATAGQGTNIGYRFDHLAQIIEQVENSDRVVVCIDTAHIFAAGYDISNDYENVITDFDKTVGLDKLLCFHFNDSKKELGSRVDRHEHIGKGFIGEKGFANLMNDDRLTHIPKILETPKGKEQLEDLENLEKLKSLILDK